MHMLYILRNINTCRKNGCRKRLSLNNSETLCLNLSSLVQSTLYLFTTCLLPALFSCSPLPESRSAPSFAAKTATAVSGIRTLDIFTFNDDELERLDSYQRIEEPDIEDIGIRSQNGDKHIVICANSHCGKEDWADVNSLQSMEDRYADLTSEHRRSILMTGAIRACAGEGKEHTIRLRNLAAEIVLRSIRCDFSGKPYAGGQITDVSIYLTDVNARCRMLAEGTVKPTHILNPGGLSMEDVMSMEEPDLIFTAMDVPVGSTACRPDIRLLCYPSSWPEESPGTPFTRLVIEGTLDGERFMWPIDINRGHGNKDHGIHRNCSYVYDVVITRKGVTDPEETITTDMMDISMEVKRWEEKERYSIEF